MPNLKITFPADGELVNHSHGTMDASGALVISVQGMTSAGRTVSLNGNSVQADEHGVFSIPLAVRNVMNEFPVTDGQETVVLRFVYDPDTKKRYNFFIDDNVFFLTELVRKRHKSIFDSFYLDFLRSLHRKYGFKVTLNTFFHNAHDPENFTTGELDTRYKAEFEDNSDWLRLAFHSYSEYPDAPYRDAYPEKLPEHHRLVTSEIKRYAGEKTLIEPVLMHWFDISNDASRKYIAEQGMNCFALSAERWRTVDRSAGHHLLARYHYKFGQMELPLLFMVNLFPEKELLAMLESAYAEKGRDFILCGTHEQYSYPFYFNYIPEHFQRFESVVRSLTDHGYECVYFTETLLK